MCRKEMENMIEEKQSTNQKVQLLIKDKFDMKKREKSLRAKYR